MPAGIPVHLSLKQRVVHIRVAQAEPKLKERRSNSAVFFLKISCLGL